MNSQITIGTLQSTHDDSGAFKGQCSMTNFFFDWTVETLWLELNEDDIFAEN